MSTDKEIDEVLSTVPERPPAQTHLDDGLLLAYQRGEVSDEEREEIEEHLARCAECRALQAEYVQPLPVPLRDWALNKTPKRKAPWAPLIGLAVAAAIAAFVLLPRDPALPGYSVSGPMGGVAMMRSDIEGSDIFVPTSQIKWLLKPAQKAKQAHLRVFVEASKDQVREVGANPTITKTGVIRYETEARALLGEDFGVRTVHLIVASKPASRAFQGSIEDLRRALGAHRWLTTRVDYRPHAEQGETK